MKLKLLILLFAVFGIVQAQSPSFLWATSSIETAYDEGSSVYTDASGNVYVTGYFQSPTITFGSITLTNNGAFDLFVVKYDAGGSVLWAKNAGGANDEVGNSISTDANGNVLVTGFFYSPSVTFGTTTLTNTSFGGDDLFVVKYDAGGNVLWAKSAGGPGYESGNRICTDANGNVLLAGNYSSTTIVFGSTTLNNSSMFAWDPFVVKYDANGNVLWANGGLGTGAEFCNGIAADANGNVLVTGYFYSTVLTLGTTSLTNSQSGSSDIFVVKYDAGGNVLWAKANGGTDEELVYSVSADANGNVLVAGAFRSPSIVFGTDTLTNVDTLSYDAFVLKYDAAGNALWAKSTGGTSSEFAQGVCTDANGGVYLAGSFYSSSLTFGGSTLNNPQAGFSDVFVLKYDAAGNELWVKRAGGTNNDVAFGICAAANGDVLMTGYFHSTSITFGTTTLTNTGGSVFVAKLGSSVIGMDDALHNSLLTVFPNPCFSSVTVQAGKHLDNAGIILHNSLGQVVKELKNVSGQTFSIALEDLPGGLYFIELSEKNKIMAVEKLMIVE